MQLSKPVPSNHLCVFLLLLAWQLQARIQGECTAAAAAAVAEKSGASVQCHPPEAGGGGRAADRSDAFPAGALLESEEQRAGQRQRMAANIAALTSVKVCNGLQRQFYLSVFRT